MKILCVYGLKTRDYAWLEDFYPCRRLKEECSARGISIDFVLPEDLPEIIPEKKSVSVCLLRGAIPEPVLQKLGNAGVPCVNTPKSIAVSADKLLCAGLFERNGIPTPKTARVYTAGRNHQCGAVPRSAGGIGFPCVIKPRYGSRGENIFLAENHAAAAAFLNRATGADRTGTRPQPYIMQEYIPFSRGRDLRVFFAGKKIIAVAERINGKAKDSPRPETREPNGGTPCARKPLSDGREIRSNVSSGGRFLPTETEKQENRRFFLEETMEKVYSLSGLFYGTADFLFKSETALVLCEINASPGFEGLEKQLHVNIAGKLIEAIGERWNANADFTV